MYLKAYQNGSEARRGVGAYLAFCNQEQPPSGAGLPDTGAVVPRERPWQVFTGTGRSIIIRGRGTPTRRGGGLSYFGLIAVLTMGSTSQGEGQDGCEI